jgi:2-polyprenyl-6-methoxyphenol hydroxylase-like FAD-dependent oxidoreductase
MTIAIVGAGLDGLVLARVLHVNGIDAVVYERESRAVKAACSICTPGPGSGRCARLA